MGRYTVIAHRPDGARTCRGYVEEVFASDFRLDTTLTRDQATLLIAEYQAQNKAGRLGQPDWEIYVLRGGEKVIDCGSPHWEGYARPGYDDRDWERDEAEAIAEAKAMLAGELIGDLTIEIETAVRPGRNVELD
jgi:hypothetical protein